jgi:hypothetical protein
MIKNMFNLQTGEYDAVQWPPESPRLVLPYIPLRYHIEFLALVKKGVDIEKAALHVINTELAMRGVKT